MGKHKEAQGNAGSENAGNLEIENILQQLAVGMVNLQKTVGNLADSLQGNLSSNGDRKDLGGTRDRPYILNWRELGGSNLSFYPNSKVHPMQFLTKLSKTLEEAGVPDDRKINLAVNCLKGAAADWVAVKEGSFQKYEDFEDSFKSRYWGLDKQRELFLEINYGRYETGRRSDYFLSLISQSKFLSQKMSDEELIDKISKHFPTEIRRGIITQGLNTIDSVEEYLRQIDERYLDEQRHDNNAIPRNRNYDNNNKKYAPRFNRNPERHVDRNYDRNSDNRQKRNTGDEPIERNHNNTQGVNLITCFNRSEENLLQSNEGENIEEYSNINFNSSNRGNNNRKINFLTRFNEGMEDLLSDPEDELENRGNDELIVPVIQGQIANQNIEILIDSGSEISAISDRFFEKLTSISDVSKLPVSGVTISVAIGGKTQRVKYQTMIPVVLFGNKRFEFVYLIIPNLNRDVILGCDFLATCKAQLNFKDLLLTFYLEGEVYNTNFDCKINKEKSLSVNICNKEQSVNEINTCRDMPTKHFYDERDFQVAADATNLGRESDKRGLFDLLSSFHDIFSESPGKVNCYVHEIDMKDDSPLKAKQYPIPFVYRQEIKNQIRDMLNSGVISAQKTEYVSPLVAVTKKDSSVRVCLDARQLNSRMNPDFVQPPNINELLLNFKRGQILSTLDLTAAYWQIPIKQEHKKYIGFLYEGQSYVFNVLLFGLSTSMASLIRCLTRVLVDECTDFTVCYVDDLLIFSESVSEHFKHLRIIFSKLQKANLTVKLRKSRFFREEIPFLGHIISSEGIRLDEKRIEAIQNFAEPRNIKELRGFLGLVNYEQRFCKNYADLTIPLLKLLKKGVGWIWGVEQKDAFSKIKEAYLQATLVVHPNLEDTFFIQCDSSEYAMGGCLFQNDRNTGERAVIAFTSKTFKGSQLNYTVTEKEALSAVHCLRQWRALVLGRDLVIITDHKSLTFLMKCHLKSSRLIRWVMYIQEFNCKIVHCSGAENITADILSRYPRRESSANIPDEGANIQVCLLKLSPDYRELKHNFGNIRADQLADAYFQFRIRILEENKTEVSSIT